MADVQAREIPHEASELTQVNDTEQQDIYTEQELKLASELKSSKPCDLDKQADLLTEIGRIYSKRRGGNVNKASNNIIKASALFNSALLRTEKQTDPDKRRRKRKMLISLLEKNEQTFFECIGRHSNQEAFPGTQCEKFRMELKALRINMAEQAEQIWENAKVDYDIDAVDETRITKEKLLITDIKHLSRDIADGIKQYIRNILQECYRMLGSSPQEFAIVGLGSLAREEMTPYSDLEFAILVKDDGQSKQYFRNLTNLFHLFVLNLGETLLPALGIRSLNDFDVENGDWFFDDVTTNGFSFDGCLPWACKTPLGRPNRKFKAGIELIMTPNNMAKCFQAEAAAKEGYHLAELLRTCTLIDGSKGLFDTFVQLGLKAGNNCTIRHHGLQTLIEDVKKYELTLAMHKTLDKIMLQNVKKEVYRLPTIITNGFKLTLGLRGNTPWELLDEMRQNSQITSEASHNMQMAVTIAVILRFMTYIRNEGQKETISFLPQFVITDDQSQDEKIYYIDFTQLTFRYYFTVVPLVDSLLLEHDSDEFVNITNIKQLENILRKNNLFKNDKHIQGRIYAKITLHKQALQCFLVAENNWKISGREKDVEFGSLLNDIGLTYANLNDLQHAKSYIMEGMQTSQQFGGAVASKNVAASKNNMAFVYHNLNEHSKALSHFLQALQIKKQIYADTPHPDIALCYHNIASVYYTLGKYDNALSYSQLALYMNKLIYGNSNHPDVAAALNSIAAIYDDLGDYTQALLHHQQALRMRKKIYGNSSHPEVASSLNNIGLLYNALQEHDNALSFLQQALLMEKQIHGNSSHPSVVQSLSNIATVYNNLGEYGAALSHQKQAMQIQEQIYCGYHSHLATTLNNISMIYKNLGECDSALLHQQRALHMFKQIYADGHPDTANSLSNISMVYKKMGEYDNALSHQQQAMQMYKKIYGDHLHPDIATSLNKIGTIYHAMGDYDNALSFHQQALDTNTRLHGRVHPDIAQCLFHVGNVYEDKVEYENAWLHFYRSLQMFRQVHGDDHPSVEELLFLIAAFLFRAVCLRY